MRREFAMPDVGEGLTEAEILTWHVAPGDTVTVNQIIVEIETAKAAVELPCPCAGTVGELLAEPGQTVDGRGADHRDRDGGGGRSGRVRALLPRCRPPRPGSPRRRAGRGCGGDRRQDRRGRRDGRIATLVGYGRDAPVARVAWCHRPRPQPGLGPGVPGHVPGPGPGQRHPAPARRNR